MAFSFVAVALSAGLVAGFPAHQSVALAQKVTGDCAEAAAQAVADTGGELLSAKPSSDGKCIITVLVQGSTEGARPRKVTLTIPM